MKSHSRCTDYRLSPLLLGPQSLINQTSLMNFHFKIPFLLFSFINYCRSPGPTLFVLHVNSNKVWFLIPSFFWCLFLLWGLVRNGAPFKLPKICGYKTKIFLWFKSVEVHSYWLLFFLAFLSLIIWSYQDNISFHVILLLIYDTSIIVCLFLVVVKAVFGFGRSIFRLPELCTTMCPKQIVQWPLNHILCFMLTVVIIFQYMRKKHCLDVENENFFILVWLSEKKVESCYLSFWKIG